MSAADVLIIAGKIFAAWSVGFAAGWSISTFREAVSRI